MTVLTTPLSIPDSSDAIYSHDIPAERPWSRILRQGQTLRIIDSEGQQAVDALLYCADNPAERYSAQDTCVFRDRPMSSLEPDWSRTRVG